MIPYTPFIYYASIQYGNIPFKGKLKGNPAAIFELCRGWNTMTPTLNASNDLNVTMTPFERNYLMLTYDRDDEYLVIVSVECSIEIESLMPSLDGHDRFMTISKTSQDKVEHREYFPKSILIIYLQDTELYPKGIDILKRHCNCLLDEIEESVGPMIRNEKFLNEFYQWMSTELLSFIISYKEENKDEHN